MAFYFNDPYDPGCKKDCMKCDSRSDPKGRRKNYICEHKHVTMGLDPYYLKEKKELTRIFIAKIPKNYFKKHDLSDYYAGLC